MIAIPRLVYSVLVGIAVVGLRGGTACAQSSMPSEVGQKVNGYQDDFDGTALSADWHAAGPATDIYEVTNGVLRVHSAIGDPNHLLYAGPGYDDTYQEVLARIRIDDFGQGDQARGGIGVGVDPFSSQGINYHFRDYNSEGQSGRHTSFLDDLRAWGPGYDFSWDTETWYWIRLKQDPDAISQGSNDDVFAKIWPADGATAEPETWQTWDYNFSRSTRTGLAGITAGSSGGLSEFEVDYILIKAAGLPQILVAPKAVPLFQTPVAITNQPQSVSVLELSPATFQAGAEGFPAPTYQWFRNGVVIPGATNTIYAIPSAALSDDQAKFKLVAQNLVSNVTHSASSSEAILTVIADTNPPTAISAAALGLVQVQVAFSERLDPASLNGSTNFAIAGATGPVSVLKAVLDPTGTNVILTVDLMSEGVLYTLIINGVTDQAAAHNRVAPDRHLTFTAVSFQAQNVGDPLPLGSLTAVAGGYDLTAGGADIGGRADQFFFSYQARSGDFDVQVRLDGIAAGDLWAKAGLLARASLDTNSAFAGVFATAGNVGSYFQSRSTAMAATASGSFPATFPDAWLRLQRVGNQFTGYASSDGRSWVQMGSANLSLPDSVLLGFAICGHGQGQAATVRFRDFGLGSGEIQRIAQSTFDPLGQSSRLTPLVISEIMYRPLKPGGRDLEYVELYNAFGTPEDISGYRLAGDIDYTFPAQTILPGGGFLVIAHNPADLKANYGIGNVLGPYRGGLPKSGGTVRLRHRTGAVFLQVDYGVNEPWPVAANGLGHSLVLARPSLGENDPQAWAASDQIGGSPGRGEGFGYEPARGVLINEFLAHSTAPLLDYIELYNHNNAPVDLTGCWLSDDPQALEGATNANQFHIPANTVIPARGFVAFDQNQLGFALNAGGETIFLANSNQTRILDVLNFSAQADGISRGRYPDGAPEFYPLSERTPGASNRNMRVNDIVINEIMYNPISGDNADQFIELHNQGTSPVDVGGWQFTQGISFQIPAPQVVAPDGYLVVAKNRANLLAHYPGTLTSANTVGDFGGTLSHGGERLVLSAPQFVVSTNQHGGVVTNTLWVEVDEVTYGTGGRWGTWSAGGGSSLELVDSRNDHRRAPNWADSDETMKSPWTIVSTTGTLDNGDVQADELQVLLQGAGECLIDDVEVINAGGVNQVANSSFENGATGWVAEGTEEQSSLENSGGYQGGKCFHIRASDRGDNEVNRVRARLSSPLAPGSTATIRAKVRWLKGHPEVLFRLRGKWLEAVGEMTLPTNLGTPGARNSRALSNAPPAIFEVNHSPVLPAVGEAVTVTARAQDADGLAAVTLNYRVDPLPAILSVPMVDDGTGGDAVASDGIFTATIPGQAMGALIAFHIQATDGHTPAATSTFPTDAPGRECLVRFGEPVQPGNIPVYRLWMTQATFTTWSSRSKLNNSPLDITFVLGNYRAVYNVQAMYAGSPYISPSYSTPSGNRCGYSISFPPDDKFLGSVDLVLDWPGGHGNEYTGIQEEMAYWIADHLNMPFSLRHFIRLSVRGVTDMQRGGVFEAINQPAGEYVKAWSPDAPVGDFYKIERGYEFSDGGGLTADPMPELQDYLTTGGVKKTSRYRWNWLKRSEQSANDYTNIFNLVDAVNAPAPEPYTSLIEHLVDVEEWMRVFAFEHIINNFDSWGHLIGKNMYAYKPEAGKWQIYPFDLDWLMLVSPGYDPGYFSGGNGPLFIGDDQTIVRMYTYPPFQRAYFRAVQDAVDGPLASANCNPIMDAKYNWLVANGVTMCDGSPLVGPAALKKWFSDRRGYLQGQLAQVAASFNVNLAGPATVTSNLVTLTGTAPITVKSILVNGELFEPVWTSVNSFILQVPLAQTGTNVLQIQAYDLRGLAITNAGASVVVDYRGAAPSPAGLVVFNEILFNPAFPDAQFVEFFNASSNLTFDLSGWRINGLGYIFGPGTVLQPHTYWTVAANRAAFTAAYPGIAADDVFPGTLSAGGETLTLIKPGVTAEDDLIVSRVKYASQPPWPTTLPGASVQLVDATQDGGRPGNWAVNSTPPLATPGTANSVRATLPAFPPVWLNEVQPENLGAILDSAGEMDPWIELYNAGTNAISLDGLFLSTDYQSLAQWGFPAGTQVGPGEFKIVFADGQPAQSSSAELHTSFRLSPVNGAVALSRTFQGQTQVLDYINYAGIRPGHSYGSLPDGQPWDRQEFFYVTPGKTNNGASTPSAVRINEWMASNSKTIVDPATGHFDDWFELYNAGAGVADLTGYYLTGNLTNKTKFLIPAGHSIPAGGFLLVWADNDSAADATNSADLHVNFKLSADGDAIGLFAPDGTAIDTVTFGPQTNDVSEGREPDGGANIIPMPAPTPRASNQGFAPRFQGLAISPEGQEARLTWSARPGEVYQLQYRDNLSSGSWQNAGSPITASSASVVTNDPQAGRASRFYRIAVAAHP